MRRYLLVLALVLTLGASSAWAAALLYAMNDQTNTLYSIDPNTFALTVVGSTGVGAGDFGDMAYNPNTNTAYWVPGRGNDNLYTLNLQTGAATLVGPHNVDDMFAMAYDTNTNKLYGESSNGNFYSISTSNGAATLLGTNSVYPGGMTYRADTNQLILLGAGTATFYALNPANGAASPLGGSGFVNDNGVAWDPINNRFVVDDWSAKLYTGDPNTYNLTQVGSLPTEFDGIIYTSGVPEPGTMLLLGTGIVGFASRLRRKV
jgi:hypothetical protein